MTIAIIGAGPAGLRAAEVLSGAGLKVDVFDRMPSLGRKFLMAGRGGLNLTHSEQASSFVQKYGPAADWMRPMLEAFPPEVVQIWADGLGQETFVGSSGRVFPKAMKASPLLRAWLARLTAQGVSFHTGHSWTGWTADGALSFETASGPVRVTPEATLLAMGGASWPRLGSDGGWVSILEGQGVEIAPLQPANMGFKLDWSPIFRDRFAGQPLKAVAVRFADRQVRGELMITAAGLEGGALYALSADLRRTIETEGSATIEIDLKPSRTRDDLTARLHATRPGESLANRLRKAAGLSPAAANLLREAKGVDLVHDLPGVIKRLPLVLTGIQGLDRAISTAGGVKLDQVGPDLQLLARPGVYLAGEMLDWEAPTGGYLLQGCLASGDWAARAMVAAQAAVSG
jgi:uncharacterized flavoprotein (TIGR03862 family)